MSNAKRTINFEDAQTVGLQYCNGYGYGYGNGNGDGNGDGW